MKVPVIAPFPQFQGNDVVEEEEEEEEDTLVFASGEREPLVGALLGHETAQTSLSPSKSATPIGRRGSGKIVVTTRLVGLLNLFQSYFRNSSVNPSSVVAQHCLVPCGGAFNGLSWD